MDPIRLANLEQFKNHFLEHPLKPVKRADLASVIQTISELFAQAEGELSSLSDCVDDLARHTGYQLKDGK